MSMGATAAVSGERASAAVPALGDAPRADRGDGASCDAAGGGEAACARRSTFALPEAVTDGDTRARGGDGIAAAPGAVAPGACAEGGAVAEGGSDGSSIVDGDAAADGGADAATDAASPEDGAAADRADLRSSRRGAAAGSRLAAGAAGGSGLAAVEPAGAAETTASDGDIDGGGAGSAEVGGVDSAPGPAESWAGAASPPRARRLSAANPLLRRGMGGGPVGA